MLCRRVWLFASLTFAVVACSGSDEPTKTPASGRSNASGRSGSSSSSSSSDTDTDTDTDGTSSSGTTAVRVISASPSDGIATFYDADGSGNCGFDATPKDLDVVALDRTHYAGSASCGACLQVKGPKATVTVRVVDSCPACASTGANLDLSAEAFAKIADPKAGKIAISYQTVACNVSGNLAYHFKDGSSQYWTAIQVRNSRVPVAKLEYQANGAWVAMKRSDDNYFVVDKGVGDVDRLALRVTSSDDQVVEDSLTGGIPSDKTVGGTKQFK